MHKNRYFLALLVFAFACFLFYAYKMTREFVVYYHFCEKAEAYFEEAVVNEIKSNHFQLDVKLLFYNKEIRAPFGDFPNRFVAEAWVKKLKEEGKISVWYDGKDFSHVVLQRHFPAKVLFSAACLLALSIYLVFLGQFATHKK